MNRNLAFFTTKQNELSSYHKIVQKIEEIIKHSQSIKAQIEIEESQKKLSELIINATLLLKHVNRQKQDAQYSKFIENMQSSVLCIPDNYHKRSNFSSLCFSVAKACVFLMALSVAFSFGYVFFAWYFSFLTTSLFVDYLVYSLATIGIPSLSMGLFSTGLGNIFQEDNHRVDELKSEVADLADLVTEYYSETDELIESNVVQIENY